MPSGMNWIVYYGNMALKSFETQKKAQIYVKLLKRRDDAEGELEHVMRMLDEEER
jgi:hypothetical protein